MELNPETVTAVFTANITPIRHLIITVSTEDMAVTKFDRENLQLSF
jgi:hypothetical protein